MTRAFTATLLLMLPLASQAADDGRISFLEQEVRNLQRQVQALTRRLDEVTSRPDRPAARAPSAASKSPVSSVSWIDAAKWRKLQPGMSELEVVELLGAPTSMRVENGARVLLYSLEIGVGGFLSGSVLLRDRSVSEVRRPELR
jgi:hypothetical protein